MPYTSSLVLVKNGNDFVALENDPENFTYFEHELEGRYLQSTLNVDVHVVVWVSLVLILQCTIWVLKVTKPLLLTVCKRQLHAPSVVRDGNAKVIVPQNQGPSVGFKLYDPNLVKDPNVAFDLELTCSTDKEAYDFMVHNTQWHRNFSYNVVKKDYLLIG